MKRPPKRKKGPQLTLAEMDPKAFEKSPHIRGFFLDTTYADDGCDRLPGYLVLRADDTRWTASLKEPTSCQQVFLAAPTLSDLWKLVEAALADEQTPWVEDSFAAARAPRARKK